MIAASPDRGTGPIIVVFGATGDLMHRMLLPALYSISGVGFPRGFGILGVARKTDLTEAAFRATAADAIVAGLPGKVDRAAVDAWCARRLYYQPTPSGDSSGFVALAERVTQLERSLGLSGDRILYLALPAAAYESTLDGLGASGLNRNSPGWTRLVIEKPFGEDLATSEALNAKVHEFFEEDQVFRIDHYLGKETVQNLLVFRFSNVLFESVWNRDRVERVEILVAEQLGVEHRAQYYDQTGHLRDMVQNHLTQLLTLTAMEVPAMFTADAIHNEKVKVLRSIRRLDTKDAIFGQYRTGSIDGHQVPAYADEPGVRPGSSTETFAAIRLEVDNWRWNGVPFFLCSGKRLARRVSQIRVRFRTPPVAFFQPFVEAGIPANELVITVQPDEGFDLVFEVKSPGQAVRLQTERMHFRYSEAFAALPGAYQTLLVDILEGDRTLFVRDDEVEESWRLYEPLLKHPPSLEPYAAGTWGPRAASEWVEAPSPSDPASSSTPGAS